MLKNNGPDHSFSPFLVDENATLGKCVVNVLLRFVSGIK